MSSEVIMTRLSFAVMLKYVMLKYIMSSALPVAVSINKTPNRLSKLFRVERKVRTAVGIFKT